MDGGAEPAKGTFFQISNLLTCCTITTPTSCFQRTLGRKSLSTIFVRYCQPIRICAIIFIIIIMFPRLNRQHTVSGADAPPEASDRIEYQDPEVHEQHSRAAKKVEEDEKKESSLAHRFLPIPTGKQRQESSEHHLAATATPSDLTPQAPRRGVSDPSPSNQRPFVLPPTRPISPKLPDSQAETARKQR